MIQKIDWSGLKVVAIALNSVNEAANRAAADLPEDERRRFMDRVNKRAYRERWLDNARALATTAPNANAMPLSKTVQSGADALASVSHDTRKHLATAAFKAAKAFAGKTGEKMIKLAKPFQQITSAAGQIGGWSDKGGEQGGDTLVLSIGGNVNLGKQTVEKSVPCHE